MNVNQETVNMSVQAYRICFEASYDTQLLSSAQSGIIAALVDSFICESRNFVCSTPRQIILGERQTKVCHDFLMSK